MRWTPLTALLILLLTLPASAGAATRWVVKGAGWGHGIGMSQYGAYGMAQKGSDYREILGHYYTDTEVGRAATQRVRILLQSDQRYVRFVGATSASGKRLNRRSTYVARASGTRVVLRTRKGKRVGTFRSPLVVRSRSFRLGGRAINGVSSGTYHGNLELRPAGGRLMAVNAVSLDKYVQGVVPGEMPSSWHPEALKAQAVAARSYALATDKGQPYFDHYPDTRSQVYRGVTGEATSTNTAVRATAGEVVKYDGETAITYFFSTSGGETENVENVFYGGNPLPYLRGVKDPTDRISPKHRWTLRYSQSGLQSRLRRYVRGRLKAVKVRKRGVSPRIVSADVIGSRGRVRVSGSNLRQALGANDNWMSFRRITTTATRKTNLRDTGLAGMVFGGGRGVVGVASPGGKVVVKKRTSKGKWKRAARGKTGKGGRYRIAVRSRGKYRVVVRGVWGPTVRVR